MGKADETRLNSLAANGFRLTPEQEEILDQADRFAENELWPLQQKMDDEEWWPPQAMPANRASHGSDDVTSLKPRRNTRRFFLDFKAASAASSNPGAATHSTNCLASAVAVAPSRGRLKATMPP